jgi:hypothetical protein
VLREVLDNADWRCEYVDHEYTDGVSAHHIRFWNTYSSLPNEVFLSQFSIRDVWIDDNSLLPVKLTYERTSSGGREARIPVEVHYSDYRDVGGVLYPFSINKKYNGTQWQAVEIETVEINEGLTEEDFSFSTGSGS